MIDSILCVDITPFCSIKILVSDRIAISSHLNYYSASLYVIALTVHQNFRTSDTMRN
jgi:hypothetical protein